MGPPSLDAAATHYYAIEANVGADLGFYKGGRAIHLIGAPLSASPQPIILTHVTGTKQFLALEEMVGARRSYDI